MYYIFRHNDDDGAVAGNLIKEYLIMIDDITEIDIYMKSISYSDILLEFRNIDPKNDFVFIVDYSFSNKENVKMFKIMLENGVRTTWIDHHKSSKELVDEINACEFSNCEIVFDTSRCGAYLTYKYIMDNIFDEDKVPLFIKYIDDYDRYALKLPNTLDFHYGMMAYEYKNKPSYFSGIMSMGTSIFNMKRNDHSTDFVNDTIEKGKFVKTLLSCINEKFCNDFGFACKIKVRGKVYRCFAGNKKEGSLVFDSVKNNFDIVIGMIFNGVDFEYSFYSKNRTDEEFTDLVECLRCHRKVKSAGGHPNAFGAVTKSPILFEDKTLVIRRNYAKLLWSRIHKLLYKLNSWLESCSWR